MKIYNEKSYIKSFKLWKHGLLRSEYGKQQFSNKTDKELEPIFEKIMGVVRKKGQN